jgi:hypothetical protein
MLNDLHHFHVKHTENIKNKITHISQLFLDIVRIYLLIHFYKNL